jgi:hypothetical protein
MSAPSPSAGGEAISTHATQVSWILVLVLGSLDRPVTIVPVTMVFSSKASKRLRHNPLVLAASQALPQITGRGFGSTLRHDWGRPS